MVQPYVSLQVIFRNNRDTLPKLLQSVKGIYDFYCFTDTGSDDGSRTLVEEFIAAEAPRASGIVNDFKWIDDFAAARQFNFESSPARWRMFLDSDDWLKDGQNLRPVLLNLELKQPAVEALFVPYDYAHLETLHTMRIVRWREGWKWNDAIHERLEFSYPDGSGLPDEAFIRVTDFRVGHKEKTEAEKKQAIRRNARIAEREYAVTTDTRYKARLARTLAMEAKMDGEAEKAIPWLEELYRDYRTYPEGRQAAADVAKSYLHLAEKATAQSPELLQATVLHYCDLARLWAAKAGPAYEALANHATGSFLNKWGHSEAAKPFFQATLKAAQRSLGRGQQTTHEGLIFEQGACYIAAADAALELEVERAADVAENLLNHVPPEIRNDATVVEHVTQIRQRIDRITILVPGTPQPFDENGGGGMLGGSEEAVLYLTRELAERGRSVRIWTVLPPQRVPGPDEYGIDWQPIQHFDKHLDDEHGTVVFWRAAGLLLSLMRLSGQRKRPLAGVTQSFLWLHDAGLGIPPDAAAIASQGCQGAIVLSDFHANVIREVGWKGELIKLSNGIVRQDFEPYIGTDADFCLECQDPSCPQCTGPGDIYPDGCGYTDFRGPRHVWRDPKRVIYSSCPSRGLVQLLEMWPKVKEEVPAAKLDIYYDWSMLEVMQPKKFEQVQSLYESVKHLDVVHHGGVDHATLHAALRRANVWAYSHFESPMAETFCISAVKAAAAGATVLTVPNGALPEVASDGHFVTDTGTYCQKLISLLKQPESNGDRIRKAEAALKEYAWDSVAEDFDKVWTVRGKVLDTKPKAVTTVA